ncbi:MAG TPA: GNAT family N-acetyltransferase, partial [Ktedonobacteraceae bacterium]
QTAIHKNNNRAAWWRAVSKTRLKERIFALDVNTTILYRHFDVQRDFMPLVTLLNDVEQTDHDGEDVSEAALREQLTWTGHNLALDRWVATLSDNTSLVGYGAIFKTPNDDCADLYVAVHPEWRRHGIGSELLAHLLERAHEVGSHTVRVYAGVQHQAAKLFLSNHGFDPVATYTRMTIPGSQSFPVPALPPGFVVRSYDQIQQIDLFTETTNRCYEGLWGHRQVSQEEVAEWLPHLLAEGIFLLFSPDGVAVGICRAEISEHLTTLRGASTGLVDAPGIISSYREANLYVPLLLTALRWLAPQSPTTIEIESWGDSADVLAQYRALGFTPMQEATSYSRDLSEIETSL